jgi:hypothetical protein
MNSEIKISGSIISELSEKIPTNIIALNELIKNSYDAGASFVTIELNTKEKQLRISDNGSGMGKKDIDILFHISKSIKKHGQKNEYGRITQGSKGLGFLSVFRFGKFVEWKTKSIKGYCFSVNFDELVSADDISHFPIELIEDNSITKGTEIIINISKYNADSLKKYFLIEKNYKKIIHSFDDNKFTINLDIDGNIYSSENKIKLLDNEKKYQLFYITYNSKTQKIIIKHEKHVLLRESFPFSFKYFSLDIELLVFYFKSHGKKKIDKLYFNQNDDLTPLIYFNINLFNNYTIFDPNIMKNIKTTQVLNQMIGFIRIVSKNPSIDFNSDRSQFLQNEKTDGIINFLYTINRKIQELGSERKDYYFNFDFLKKSKLSSANFDPSNPEKYRKLVKDDFIFKNKIDINIYIDKILFTLFSKTRTLLINNNTSPSEGDDDSQKRTLVPAEIILNCNKEQEIYISSGQIDLRNYIESIHNSDGELVNKEKLTIKVDGIIIPDGILPSEEVPCNKNISFIYIDSKTDKVAESLTIHFVEPVSSIITNKKSNLLLVIPAKENYNIDLNKHLGNLINQINNLEIKKNREIISCSLRALFELSVDCIIKSNKYTSLFDNTNGIDDRVVKIIGYVKSKEKYISAISNNTKIDYKSLKNFLGTEEYNKIVTQTHLGSHKSSMFIEEPDIRKIALYAVYIIIFANEMIHNPELCID